MGLRTVSRAYAPWTTSSLLPTEPASFLYLKSLLAGQFRECDFLQEKLSVSYFQGNCFIAVKHINKSELSKTVNPL